MKEGRRNYIQEEGNYVERHRDKKKCGIYLIEKTIFRYGWSFLGIIKQRREKSVTREENRPNYE